MKNIMLSLCLIFYIIVGTKTYEIKAKDNLYYPEGHIIEMDEENWLISSLILILNDAKIKEVTK